MVGVWTLPTVVVSLKAVVGVDEEVVVVVVVVDDMYKSPSATKTRVSSWTLGCVRYPNGLEEDVSSSSLLVGGGGGTTLAPYQSPVPMAKGL